MLNINRFRELSLFAAGALILTRVDLAAGEHAAREAERAAGIVDA